MTKSIVGALVGVGLLFAATPVMAAGLTESQIQAILSLLSSFGAESKVIEDVRVSLGGKASTSGSGSSNSSSSSGASTKENLTISSIDLSLPAIGAGTDGSVPEQKVTIMVKNDQYGSYSLSGKKFKYAIYLYEIKDGEKTGKIKAATGEALVPYANGYSEFSAYVEGGFPYDGSDFERDYIAEVRIDTANKVKESNEKDNAGWSKSWLTDYYKG